MYIKTPELNITEEERKELIQCFYDNEHNKTTYISKKGTDTTLTILTEVDTVPSIMQKLIDKIPKKYYHTFVFLGNNGSISPHVDDTRQAVITFPLITDDTPTSFIEEKDYDSIVDELFYNDNQTVLWNTKAWHKVVAADQFRLFFQIELNPDNTYEDYEALYKEGKLFI